VDNFPILSLTTFLPLVGVLIIFFWTNASEQTTKQIALWTSIATFVVSLGILLGFDRHHPGMQLTEHLNWLPSVGANYDMGVDGVSLWLVLLTTLTSVVAVLWSTDTIGKRVREYYIALLLLEVGMVGVFLALDLFVFYIFFELTLIPMALLIGFWGSQNRVYAAVKFFLYTLAGSLLMLVAIVATYQEYFNQTGVRSLNIVDLASQDYGHTFQMWAFAAFSSPSRSRFRSGRSTPGCPMPTSRRRPLGR
jgi:NADH-quinone oxidoreductase subunit M